MRPDVVADRGLPQRNAVNLLYLLPSPTRGRGVGGEGANKEPRARRGPFPLNVTEYALREHVSPLSLSLFLFP